MFQVHSGGGRYSVVLLLLLLMLEGRAHHIPSTTYIVDWQQWEPLELVFNELETIIGPTYISNCQHRLE
jgi:hypothetical protein